MRENGRMCASQHLRRMADGTVKQVNPLTGTRVWTVPGRGNRPLGVAPASVEKLGEDANVTSCAFCTGRYLETPPEKVRTVRTPDGFLRRRDLTREQITAELAEFRRIPNLFEIMSVDYWQANYGLTIAPDAAARAETYANAPGGTEHLTRLAKVRLGQRADGLSEAELLEHARDFFVSTHDVIVARRHFVDGATTSDQLASSGSLSVDEHREYIGLAVDGMRDLYESNPHVKYVSVFQNWLKPAGASFDHLHKQMVGIDEHGVQVDANLRAAAANPNVFNEAVLNEAVRQNLVVAQNEHAIAIAGFGHRYPSLEVWSTSATCEPWMMSDAERTSMADLIHALHAATGADVPCNEEWHHRPPGVEVAMPWHVVLKWRISNLAGFEGDTQIYLNTLSPWDVRDRVLPRLSELHADGHIAETIQVGADVRVGLDPLAC